VAHVVLQEWKLQRFGHDGSKRCIDLAFLRALKLDSTEVTEIIISLASGRLIARRPLEKSGIIFAVRVISIDSGLWQN